MFEVRAFDTMSAARSQPVVFWGGAIAVASLASALGAFFPRVGGLLMFAAWLAMLVGPFLPSRTHVGLDGVTVRWLGRTRFIPLAEITEVRADTFHWFLNVANAVVIKLRSGDVYRLPTNQSFFSGDELPKEIAAVITAARRLAERTRVEPNPSLRRDGRSYEEWVRALREGSNGDFRTPALPRTDLFDVIESGTASPLDRVAAMVALGPATTDDELARLDRIAERFAGPELSVALEIGPKADEARLAQLVEEVESGAIGRMDPEVAREKTRSRLKRWEQSGRSPPLVADEAITEEEEVEAEPQDVVHNPAEVVELAPQDITHDDVITARRVPAPTPWTRVSAALSFLLASMIAVGGALASGASQPLAWMVAGFVAIYGVGMLITASNRRHLRVPVTLRFDEEGFAIEQAKRPTSRIEFAEIEQVAKSSEDLPFGLSVRARDEVDTEIVLFSDDEAYALVRRLHERSQQARRVTTRVEGSEAPSEEEEVETKTRPRDRQRNA